ncbi:hypothetical protein BN1723_009119, partial [Verticillium longisporum]
RPVPLRRRFSVKQSKEETEAKFIPVLLGSPRQHYKSRYSLQFGSSAAVVTSTASRLPLMIRSISRPSTAEYLELYTCPQEGYSFPSFCQPPSSISIGRRSTPPSHSSVPSCTSYDGKIKIYDVERCTLSGNILKLLDSFTRLMIELIDKKGVGERVAGLMRPDYWSHEAIDMLNEAVLKLPIKRLLEYPFLGKRD